MKNLITYLSKKSLSLGNGSGMTRKRLGIDSGMTRFCVVSLIYANKLLNHRTTPLGRFVLPEHLSFSKPKVNWLLHVQITRLSSTKHK